MGTMGVAARQLLQARAEAEEKALALQTAQAAEAAKAVSKLEWSDDEDLATARGGKDGFVGRFEAAEELLYDTFTGYPFVEDLIVDPGRIWI